MKSSPLYLLLFSLCALLTAHSTQAQTSFKWIKQSEDIYSANCYEVDVETGGEKYMNKVKAPNCRPKEWIHVFDLKKGECFQADAQTTGDNYYSKVDKKFCRPKETKTAILKINGRAGCFEVDAKTQGKLFYERLSSRKCAEAGFQNYWNPKDEWSGVCYRVSMLDESARTKTRDEECKPEQTVFRFRRTSPFSGSCYETHAQDPKRYASKTKTENCRPAETIFIFYRPEGRPQGKCYELDEQTKGDHYLKKVRNEDCKNAI